MTERAIVWRAASSRPVRWPRQVRMKGRDDVKHDGDVTEFRFNI